MKNPYGGRQSWAPVSLLDIKTITARRRKARMYHRVISGMTRIGYLRFLTLTTAEGVSNEQFQKDFRKLYMRLRRRNLIVDYIRAPELTARGRRHDHILFRGSYIEQVYLSKLWGKIHGSPIVDIRRMSNSRKTASYISKYMSKETVSRMSYSAGWVWRGFCKSWENLKKYSREQGWSYKELLTSWEYCIRINKTVEEVFF